MLVGAAGLALAVSAVAAEAILRTRAPEWAVVHPPVNFRPDLFEAAPFGYRLKAGGPYVYAYARSRLRPVTIHVDRDGFRSRRPAGTADSRPRIGVLGDSMVFGQGVEEDERFTELIEARRPGWRVDNLGMVGFGTDLMIRALEAVGLREQPTAVVLCVYTDDLRRVVTSYVGMGFPLPKYVLANGALETIDYPEPRLWERLRLYQAVHYAVTRRTPSTFPLNEAILDRFLDLSEAHAFVPVVVYAPSPDDGWDDRMRRDFLGGWAADRGARFLDLGDAIARAGGKALYLDSDSHWNAAGHAVVAAEMTRYLERAVPALAISGEDGKNVGRGMMARDGQ